MVTAKESQTYQQFTFWNSQAMGHMARLQLEQNYGLPCSPPILTANAAFPGQSASDLCGLNTGQQDAVGGFLKLPPPYCENSYPIANSALPHGLGVMHKPIDASCSPQKRFLIFDQSGNHTRLFFSPSFSPHNQINASIIPTSGNGPVAKVMPQVDQQFLVKSIVEEKWDENHLTDGEGEMLEDTEEIDALLYSDSDDEFDADADADADADGENDEVTSNQQTPFSIQESYNKDKLLEELTEEVASSDGSPKRQRLLDGRYRKSSLVSVESPVKRASSCSYDDDVESSCAGVKNSYDDIDLSKRGKKVKICEALKILETIIPGLKSKDPLSVIDKAIVYLKSMKVEAEALHSSYPECKSATFP